MCSLEVDPLQNVNGNVEVIIIADTRHIQRRSELVDVASCLLVWLGSFGFFGCVSMLVSAGLLSVGLGWILFGFGSL